VIRCVLRLGEDGCLRGLRASGHAGSGARGEDLVCAAATALLRTASRLLYQRAGLSVSGGAPAPGEMSLEVDGVWGGEPGLWLRGVTDFLITGLQDLQSEHPRRLEIVIFGKGNESHGT
jgi:uncharacterized protein YsxB (DUF464 family)